MLIPFFAFQFTATPLFPPPYPETCRDVLCPGSSTCVVDQTNNAYCVTCNRICPEVTSPEQHLCGNDGIVYASACHLRRATCLLGRSIGVAYEGKCISKSPHQAPLCSPGCFFSPDQLCSYSAEMFLPTFLRGAGLGVRVFGSCWCFLKN